MSTYQQGNQDYIAALQPFQPDLNYYSGVLATKQGQYDQGLSKVNSIYSSVFNSPMTRQENIEQRDKYFKTIEQSIKKVAGMDLSKAENVQTAQTLFDPILNDKNIVADMVYTKGAYNALNTGEQYRNVVDPDKAGGAFWNEGLEAIHYQLEEYKNTTADNALKMSAPKFVPYQNVTKKAIKAAKDAGFNISSEYVKDGYNITDENGYLLLGQVDKKGNKISEGILPQYLYGMFGNDSAVQDMYKTQAYVHRKNASKQLAVEHGISEDQAESMYLNDVMARAVPKLEKSREALTAQRNTLKANSAAIAEVAKAKGGVIPGDGIMEAYDKLQSLLAQTEPAEAYHDNVANLISSAPNLNDLNALRNRVDGIVANSNFMNSIDAAATEYAMGTAKHKMDANPYALASFNNQLDISKAKQLKDYDHAIWMEQQGALGNLVGGNGKNGYLNEVTNQLVAKGINWDDLAKDGVTPQNFKTAAAQAKLAALGVTTSEKVEVDKNFLQVGSDSFENTYQKNAELTSAATENALTTTTAYLNDVAKSMRTAYINAASNPDKKKGKIIQDQILSDARAMSAGTGFHAERFLTGNASPKDFVDQMVLDGQVGKVVNTYKTLQQNSPAAQVYSAGWSVEKMLAMEAANQTAHGLLQKREETQKAASDAILTEYQNQYANGDMKYEEYVKKQVMFHSTYDEKGNLRPLDKQKELYVKHMSNVKAKEFTGESLDKIVSELNPMNPGAFVSGYKYVKNLLSDANTQADKDFEDNYVGLQTNFNSRLTSLSSKRGSADEGGAQAVEKSAILPVTGAQPYSTNYIGFKNIAKDALSLSPGDVRFSSVTNNPDDLNNDKEALGKRFLSDVASGNIKNVNFTYQVQDVPKRYDAEAFEGTNLPSPWTSDMEQKQRAVLGLDEFPGTLKPGFVAVKITLPEDKVRDYLGLKKTDPVEEADKTFIVSIPSAAKSLSGLTTRIGKTPTDIYMQTEDARLNFNMGKNGGFVLHNEGGGLSYTPSVYQLNEATGKVDLVTKDPIPLNDLKTEDAILAAKYSLDKLNAVEAARQKTYLLLQQAKENSNAKSR